jgi:hypothetical protein
MLHNWIGAVTTALGGWLVFSGLAHRRRVLMARRRLAIFAETGALPPSEPRLATFGAIARPIILGGLGYFALKLTVAYALFGGNRLLSPLDFAGTVFLLAAYGAWLMLKTSYREPASRHPPTSRGFDATALTNAPAERAVRAAGDRERVLDRQV